MLDGKLVEAAVRGGAELQCGSVAQPLFEDERVVGICHAGGHGTPIGAEKASTYNEQGTARRAAPAG
jgi:hypothetical protein